MQDFRTVSATQISDHEIHVFYNLPDISPSSGPTAQLGDLVCDKISKCIVPDDQISAISGRYKDVAIWETAGKNVKRSVSPDLVPAIRELLAGDQQELSTFWKLSPIAKKFIENFSLHDKNVNQANRDEKIVKKEIRINFSDSAQERLKDLDIQYRPLLVRFESISITSFATGLSFAVARISVHHVDGFPVFAAELAEVVHAVARFNTCNWVMAAPLAAKPRQRRMSAKIAEKHVKKISGPNFSLGEFVGKMAFGDTRKINLSKRVPTYVFARTEKVAPKAALDILGSYFARRYSSAYQLEINENTIKRLKDFNNLRHVATQEGFSTVISPQQDGSITPFLANWKQNSFRNAYSPLVLLLLHEDWFLTRRRSHNFLINDASAIPMFEKLINESLIFRLCFRHTFVSKISMHNEFSGSIREIMKLDHKLTEYEGDITAMSKRLITTKEAKEVEIEENKNRRYYFVGAIGSASLAGLTAFTIVKEGLGVYPEYDAWGPGKIAFWSGIYISIYSFIFFFLMRPSRPKHASKFTPRAIIQQMRRRASK